jgi:two-component system KDP operon response regulator KdpE
MENQTILIVDDEPQIVQLIKMNLELEGFRSIDASDGYQAVEKVVKELPDLLSLTS